ncbi:hypothetical protein AJ88_20845 [Mesorhizobium amorphae CCBAU 01583]|nr:hypothetical protein AJ88_20845 [Mesorhizobium amorphae CCBAU 01583]
MPASTRPATASASAACLPARSSAWRSERLRHGEAHGVIVQAESSEEVTNVTVAGAGGLYVGLAGSVTVTLLNSDTKALIGVGADINQGAANYVAHPGTVSGAQGVYVNAANEVRVTSFAGALGAGFIGLAGGIDFGSIKNDTVAAINANAMVRARGDVSVNAVAIKVLRGFAFSGGIGVGGLGASVSVWSVGEEFSDSYQDNQGGSGNATKDDGSSKTANDEAGEQADDGVEGVTGELSRFGGGANNNTADSRVKAGVEGARDKVGANALTSGALTNKLTAAVTDERGTTASVEGGATVEAGHDIVVNAREQMEVDMLVGSLGAGLVGLGASISVVNVSGQVRAKAGGSLKAGNAIRVESHFGRMSMSRPSPAGRLRRPRCIGRGGQRYQPHSGRLARQHGGQRRGQPYGLGEQQPDV